MKILKNLVLSAAVAVLAAACGGGGGDPGTPGSGGGAAVNGIISVQTYSATSGNDVAVNTFSSSDPTVHVRAVVRDKSGSPLQNLIVKFTEDGTGLLEFMPSSATALTSAGGVAEVDVKASSVASLGATRLVATTSVVDRAGAQIEITGSQNISISAASIGDPQDAATSLNFTSVTPADKSIVIAGGGGQGRTETALLTFTVVDSNGSPIKGVVVDFNVVPEGSVILNTPVGKSNSSGQVIASVTSKSQPTSVIVNARVRGKNISTQSDTLTVTTGVATQTGFDLSASKYNMDYDLSGDSSTVNVKIVDANGNPVADGVPVVAQSNYGRVGSADRGGCTTINGGCSVDYQVQNPRPADGVPVSVVFSTQTGQGAQISDSLKLWITSVSWLNLYDGISTTSPRIAPVPLSLASSADCKFSGFSLFVGTPKGYAAPAGTSITVRSQGGISTPTIVAGTPTLDRSPVRTALEFSATGESGAAGGLDTWIIQLTAAPSKMVRSIQLPVQVPACP